MPKAQRKTYLAALVAELQKEWPGNRTINLVFHGHSVPSGYFATPTVDTFNAYPHLLHRKLKQRFPMAVINCIVTAIGGENSTTGAVRFESDVLVHRPDVVFIDYALNDRGLGLDRAGANWRLMLEAARARGVKVILLTPTADLTQATRSSPPAAPVPKEHEITLSYAREDLPAHADLVRRLAAEYGVGLADSLASFARYDRTRDLRELLSWVNHPNRKGHQRVANELAKWFPLPSGEQP